MNKNQMTKKTAFALAQHAIDFVLGDKPVDPIDVNEACAAWDVIQKEIDRLERVALKAKTGETKADKAKAEFRQTVLELVADAGKAFRAGEVAQELGVSTQKASAALNALVAQGALIKVNGEKRTVLFAVPGFETEIENDAE